MTTGLTSEPRVRGRRPPHGEPVLDRAFRILGAFGPAHRTLSLTSLSVRAGLPKATTLRLARKLVEWGALERTTDGEYMVGLRLLELASLAPRGHGLRATALPYLQDLHHATGQHVLLAVRDGHEAVLVERLSARGAGRVMYRVGGRMPLHSTGVGLILLAYAPRAVQDEVLAGDLRLEPEHAELTPAELRGRLAAVRHTGVAIVSRPQPEPMTSVACAIGGRPPDPVTRRSAGSGWDRAEPATGRPVLSRSDRGEPVAALSVVCRSDRAEPAVLTPAVVAVARAISRAVAQP